MSKYAGMKIFYYTACLYNHALMVTYSRSDTFAKYLTLLDNVFPFTSFSEFTFIISSRTGLGKFQQLQLTVLV